MVRLLKKYFGKSNCLEESSRILWYCPNLFVFWPFKFFLKNYPNILTTVQAKRLYSSFLKLRTSAFSLSYDCRTVHQNFQHATRLSTNHSSALQSKLQSICGDFWKMNRMLKKFLILCFTIIRQKEIRCPMLKLSL